MSHIVNRIGKFDGSKAVEVKSAGEYILDVMASSNWTIDISQPIPNFNDKDTQFHGTANQATGFFWSNSGLKIFNMKYSGKNNYIVWLIDDSGRRLDCLVNTVGKFDGSKAVKIFNSGYYLLDVTAEGSWSIDLE